MAFLWKSSLFSSDWTRPFWWKRCYFRARWAGWSYRNQHEVAPTWEQDAGIEPATMRGMKTRAFCSPAHTIDLENLLTTEQVAADLKIAPKTVRALCASRALSAVRICRRWRIPLVALQEFKRSHLSPRV